MSRYDSGSSNGSCGIGFTGLLTIAFIVLKLTGFIDWSWWWVLSPMWISLIVVIALSAISVFVSIGYVPFRYKRGKKSKEKNRKEKME